MATNEFALAELEPTCHQLREWLKTVEDNLRGLMKNQRFDGEQAFEGQHGEMKANIMLAVRHVEDARMRCGKVLQYADDGVSILDKITKDEEPENKGPSLEGIAPLSDDPCC